MQTEFKASPTLRNRGRPAGGMAIKRSLLITPQIDEAIVKFTSADPAAPTFSQAVRSLIIIGLKAHGIAV